MDYQQWRRLIEEEVSWRQINQLKDCWNINGQIVFDSNKHAINHCGYTLLEKALQLADLSQQKVFKQTVYFQQPVGFCDCVETTDSDSIIYLQRDGRKRVSRFVLGRNPELCNSVHLILKRMGSGNLMLITAWVGTESQPEPWDKKAGKEAVTFWKHHALVAVGVDKTEDLGDSGYWN